MMDMSLGFGIAGQAASVGVGLIFLTAGWTKLRHYALVEGVVANYRVLPRRLVVPAARALPVVEAVVGVGLIAAWGLLPVLMGAALLLAFAGAMAVNIRRGRTHIDCGCGLSHLRQHIGWPLVGRNLALVALLVPRLLPSSALAWPEAIAASLGGLALFIAYLLFNAVDALSQSSAAAFRRSGS